MLRDLLSILAFRPLREQPARTALALLGIACGTALYAAIAMINTSTIAFFSDSVSALTGTSSVSISGGATGFPEGVIADVERVPGVDRVVPIIQVRSRAGADQGQGVVVLGIDMLRDVAVRKYSSDDSAVLDDPLEFLNQENAVLIPRAYADENHLAVGSPLELSTASGPQRFIVRGVLGASGAAKAFGGRVVFMDIDAARVSFGKEGRTDRLDVLAKKGVDEGELSHAIEAALGSGFHAERPENQTEAFRKMIYSYQKVLADLARLALMVAVLLVANTMTVNVSERRKEIGVLRALGATRRLVLVSFLVMSAIIGLAGAALGLPLGMLLARLLVGAVSRSVALTYATPIDVASLHLTLPIALIAVGGGLGSALVGGFLPAYRASTVSCSEALRPKDVDVAPKFDLRVLVGRILGVLLLAYVPFATSFEIESKATWLRDSTLTVAYVGGALIAPWLANLVLRAMRAAVERSPLTRIPSLSLALASLASSSRRAAGGTTLAAALVLVLMMTTTHASLKQTLSDATERMLTADVWVSQKGMFLTGDDTEAMREELGAELDAIPGVDVTRYGGAHAVRTIKVQYAERSVLLKAWDRPPRERAPIVMLDGEEGRDALFAAGSGAPIVLVSENFASRFKKHKGDDIILDTPSGRMSFRVGGVMLDLASPEGTLYLSRAAYKRIWRDSLVSLFYVYAAPGTSPIVVRDRIDQGIARRNGLITNVTADVKSLSQEVLDDAFAYTRAIELAALVVGFLGLVSTVLVGILERKREIGMLRAIGMSARQLSSMIALEMAFLGISSATVALVLGGYLSHVWLAGAFAKDIGWPIAVHVPLFAVAGTLLAGAVVGIVAGSFGAERVRRVELALALAYE